MPYSAEEGRPLMFSWMCAQEPESVLDIGAGSGTYGRMFRELPNGADKYLMAVEVWSEYVVKFDLHSIYDYVLVGDIRFEDPVNWSNPDVIILGDVLEHMPEQDAVKVWERAKSWASKAVYLSIPIIDCPQGSEHGNPYEKHVVADWTAERVLDTFKGITWQWHGQVVGRYEAVVSR